uniref:Uncharacterized protein n=1 Tax=Anopheles coluzzii TaxID=1518534 RepID=A0A8W7PYQ7_ANOCL
MRRMLLGEMVLDHQRAFRGILTLVFMLLVVSNGWYVYSRSLSLSDQYAHRAVAGLRQHFEKISGLIDTIQAEAVRELQWGEPSSDVDGQLSALRNVPGTDYFSLDRLPPQLSHQQIGNLTGLVLPGKPDPARQREIAVALGLAPMMTAAYRNLDEHGVAWVYYVSRQQFIYLYPFTPAADFHYSAGTPLGVFWRMVLPEVNPEGRRIMTPVYIDQAGKGAMLTI